MLKKLELVLIEIILSSCSSKLLYNQYYNINNFDKHNYT